MSASHSSGDTIVSLLKQSARDRGAKPMVRRKSFGTWHEHSWIDVSQSVHAVAAGLIKLGAVPGDVVSIVSNTRLEWLLADLGSAHAGCVVHGIYPSTEPKELESLCRAVQTKYVFVEDVDQLAIVLDMKDRLPKLLNVFVLDDRAAVKEHDVVLKLQSLIEEGEQAMKDSSGDVDARRAGVRPDDSACIVQSAGTSGSPRNVLLSHANIVAAVRTCAPSQVGGLPAGSDRIVFLPMCQIRERVEGVYSAILLGHVLNFVEGSDTTLEDMREVRPHLLCAVPRVWEQLHADAQSLLDQATPFQQWAYGRAIKICSAARSRRLVDASTPLGSTLAQALVLGNLKRLLGIDRVQLGTCSGGTISPTIVLWFQTIGIDLREAWGAAETSGVGTVAGPNDEPGTIGRPLPGFELRISVSGELQIRGPSISSRYLASTPANQVHDHQGWWGSGDIATKTADGSYALQGRFTGYPKLDAHQRRGSDWERRIRTSALVIDARVRTDAHNDLIGIILIDQNRVKQWARSRGTSLTSEQAMTDIAEVVKLLEEEVEKVNETLPVEQRISQVRLLNPQNVVTSDLTPLRRLRWATVDRELARELLEEKFRITAGINSAQEFASAKLGTGDVLRG